MPPPPPPRPSDASVLLFVDPDAAPETRWTDAVRRAAAACVAEAREGPRARPPGAEPRLLVFFCASNSESASESASAASASRRARLLEACYDAIADVAPTLDLIPLLPSLGWDAASVALELVPRDAEWRCAAVGEGRADAAAAAAVSARASDPRGGFRPLVPIDARDAETTKTTKTTKTAEARGRTPDATWSAALRAPPGQRRVSVGGTFDRMHAGHRLLLAAAALATWGSAAEGGEAGRFEEGGDRAAEDRAEDRGEDPSGAEDREEDVGRRRASSSEDDASDATLKRPGPTLFVGVTGPALLGKKARAELLEPYEVRASRAEAFARACVRFRASEEPLDVRVGPLDASPPLAATTRAMTALATSRETAAGGAAINDARREAGFEALALLEVGLVGGGGGEEGGKLSSSALRDAEARRRTDGDGDADEVNTKG